MNILTDAPVRVQLIAAPSYPETPTAEQLSGYSGSSHFSQSEQLSVQLVESLQEIPQDWVLTPVNQKRPLRPGWQVEVPLPRGYLAHQLLNGTALTTDQGEYTQQWDGVGVRTGSISDGLIGIDVDGPEAEVLLATLSGGELPPTPSWTSGKPGRRALVCRLSESAQALLAENGWGGKKLIIAPGQELHFRYDGHQQVLPPSAHPETGQYRWLTSPAEADVAPAPAWLESLVGSWVEGTAEAVTAPAVVEVSGGFRKSRPTAIMQLWGDSPAPGRINQDDGLMRRWNALYITQHGETNNTLLEFTRLLRDAGLSCAEGIEVHKHFGQQIPGYQRYASRASRRDLEGSTWAERQVANWWKRANLVTIPRLNPADLNQVRHESAVRRIIEAISSGVTRGCNKVRELVAKLQEYTFEKFGIRVAKRTLYKPEILALWHPDYCRAEGTVAEDLEGAERGESREQKVELLRGVEHLDTARLSGRSTPPPKPHPRFTLILPLAFAQLATPAPISEPPAQAFRKGDQVRFDDGTGLPYCGQVVTIQARVTDDGGNTCYRLNIDYQGRTGTKARKVEALPSFLTLADPAPIAPIAESAPPTLEPPPDYLEASWQVLEAVLGSDGNPFVGGSKPWRVTAADIGKAAYRRLRDYLGGATHA